MSGILDKLYVIFFPNYFEQPLQNRTYLFHSLVDQHDTQIIKYTRYKGNITLLFANRKSSYCVAQCPGAKLRKWIRHLGHASMHSSKYNKDLILMFIMS